MVESMMVDQSEAGAVNEAKVFVVVSNENRPSRLFNRVAHTNDFDTRPVEGSHKRNGSLMTDFQADYCVRFGKNKIGGQELSVASKQFPINRHRSGVIPIVLVSQGKKGTRIQKDFQSY